MKDENVSMIDQAAYTTRVIAGYTAYPWENVLPAIRILGLAHQCGDQVLQGSDYFKELAFPDMISLADVVWIQRDFPRYKQRYASVIERARAEGKPIIYDIDDLLFDMPSSHPDRQINYYRDALAPMLHTILDADLVTTTTLPLATYIRKFHSNVQILPNALDDRFWQLRAPVEADPFEPVQIGYMGTSSHLPDLEMIAPVLMNLERRYKTKVSFKFWVEKLPESLQKLEQVKWIPMREGNYANFISYFLQQKCDIFVAPLIATSFNACKSPIKYLEYSAMGVPGVFSRLAPYESVVTDGQNGFLAGDNEEWEGKLSSLIEKKSLRVEIARAAQQNLQVSGFMSHYASTWRDIVDQTLSQKKITTPDERLAIRVIQRVEAWNQDLLENFNQTKADLEAANLKAKNLQDQVYSWEAKWFDMQQGITWKIIDRTRRMRLRLAPRGTRRDRIVQNFLAVARTWNREGIKVVWVKSIRKLRHTPPALPAATSSIAVVSDDQTQLYSTWVGQKREGDVAVALYTPDIWTSASPFLRLVGPSQHPGAGFHVLQGSRWEVTPRVEFHEEADLVVIQRDFPRYRDLYTQVIQWARAHQKPVVYEIDDLLLELPPEHMEKNYYAREREPMLRAAAEADAVTVSTSNLAEYFRSFNPNAWVLPNYLNDSVWTLSAPVEKAPSAPVVIGYMGGITKTHLMDLELVTPTLQKLLKRYGSKIKLRFWGVVPPELTKHPRVEFVTQTFAEYPIFAGYFSTAKADLFIAPLRDNLFNRCKSAIKFLEYSSLAVPGVFSRIAPYEELVVEGSNGFLASTAKDWETTLTQLIEDDTLRRTTGQAAQQTVRDNHRLSLHAQEWGNVYKSIINHPRKEKMDAQAEVMVNYQISRWYK